MNAMREKVDSNEKEMKEEIKTNQAKMDAWLEEMKAWRKNDGLPRSDGDLCRKGEGQPSEDEGRPGRNGGAVDVFEERLYKMDTTDLEANRENSEAVTMHQEVPNEEAEVETVGALEDRYRDQNLDIGRRRQPKKRTRGDGGCRQKLVAARGQLTRRAIPAPRKGRHQGPVRNNVARGAHNGRTLEIRRWKGPECNNEIKDRGARRQIRLGSEGALNKTVRQTLGQEVAKRAVEFFIGLLEVSDWTLWRGRPPPKRKNIRPKHSPRKRTKMMTVYLDRLASYQGTARDGQP
jgi:hypothetical protein